MYPPPLFSSGIVMTRYFHAIISVMELVILKLIVCSMFVSKNVVTVKLHVRSVNVLLNLQLLCTK